MTEKDLARVLRDSVSDVRLSPSVIARIQERTNGGRQMRHKWKAGLVLAIALLLATAVAGAWSLSREFFEKTAELQYESGYYDDWSLEEKRGFVDIMAEYGLVDQDAAKELKRRDEAGLDAWMAERYGVAGRTDVIGLTSILETEMGEMVAWPNETWVWYNDMELRLGLLTREDDMICVTPGEEAVPPETALAAAREAIAARDGGPSMSELAAAKAYWTYEVELGDKARDGARYYIRFELADGANVWVEVERDGTAALPEGINSRATGEWDTESPHFDAYLRIERDYAEAHGLNCGDELYWSVADKAAVAALQAELVKEAILANSWELIPGELHQTVYTYGVPEEGDLPLEDALALAREAILAIPALPEEAAQLYFEKPEIVQYFTRGASDDGHPVWEIFFTCSDPEKLAAYDLATDKNREIGVRIDAATGRVLRCEARLYGASEDERVQAMRELLDSKGAPANWTEEEWNEYLPWPRP